MPVRDLVRQACGIRETDNPEAITCTVHRYLQEAGLLPEEALPVLLQLLGIPLETLSFTQLSPQVRKARTFTALHQVIQHVCRRQPLVLAVENLHWMDALSAEWLATLVEWLASTPILVLGTYRPGYRPPWLGQSVATQVALPRLTARDSLTVVRSVLPTMPLPEAVRQELVTNPPMEWGILCGRGESNARHEDCGGVLPSGRHALRPAGEACRRQPLAPQHPNIPPVVPGQAHPLGTASEESGRGCFSSPVSLADPCQL